MNVLLNYGCVFDMLIMMLLSVMLFYRFVLLVCSWYGFSVCMMWLLWFVFYDSCVLVCV